ncbi:hypothetical protein FKW77_010689 [Venturia effusa]|uniref:DNA mismatch repair protein S5 domain-containing protein n=1 Tax=Venturia effusa TaxID=50376 RepID=A0A517KY68_9PEZI|nr:hypothetical protein FKW77_010689 [Venturia effusa]
MSMVASIKALPPSTVHRIGSSQVLVDSSSVVKELVDNSIDARATSISIEVAANSLDIIQVTDNGHGIVPEDRAIVCRRYTTSKISDFSDLLKLGGTSLGFRGEALHSLANLSGSLSVTTRVDGEMAALKLIVAKTGEVEARETASHPVGTTVRATDFFSSLPVRKQTALKAATKILAKIKRMLKSYALARPSIRFSLKVLKAKTATGNFLYAPRAGSSSVQDAALKLFGNCCTSQCSWHVLHSHGFELQALCPAPEAVSAKISNIGQFLSVDCRPMTTARGTMKQIISLFKEKMKKSSNSFDSIKDPFLCLNIICPIASYDPNIEPSKDDVLFDDSGKVIAAVTELFAAIYPVQEQKETAQSILTQSQVDISRHSETITPLQPRQRQPSPEAQMSQEPQIADTVEDDFGEEIVLDDEEMSFLEHRAHTPAWRSNMYGCDEEDLELLANSENRPLTQESAVDSREAAREINPWTIAKMNAPVRPNSTNDANGVRPVQHSTSMRDDSSLFTPARSSLRHSPVTPVSSWTAINQHRDGTISAPLATRTRHSQVAAYGYPTPHASSSPVCGTLLEDIPESTTKSRPKRPKANIHTPFVNPMKDSNWDFGPPSWPRKKSKSQGNRSNKDIRDAFSGIASQRSVQDTPLVIQGEPIEATAPSSDAMLHEFNARLGGNEAVPETLREMGCSVTRSTRSRPNSGQAARSENPRRVDDDDGSRPPAKRRRTTEGGKRSKSSLLPLERVPEKQQMHKFVLNKSVSLEDITHNLERLNTLDLISSVPWDCDADSAARVSTFDQGIDSNLFGAWSRRIKICLEEKLRRLEVGGDGEEVLICIGALSRLERVGRGMEIEVGENERVDVEM